MAVFLEISRLLLVFDDVDFCRAADFRNRGVYLCAFDERCADCCVGAIINEQNLIEDDRVALFVVTRKFLDFNLLANRNLILFASSLDYREF